MKIGTGLAPGHRRAAARIYWQAFGAKLGRVLGPEDRALAYLDRVMRADHCLTVTQGDDLLGIAGFKSPKGAFVGGDFGDMAVVHGWPGATWRSAALWSLSREVDNDRFLIDGIAVDALHRGRGVGTMLLAGLCDEARRRHYPAIRLEVVDTNPRARALYERQGFRALRTDPVGPLHRLFGFRAATVMVRDLT